jgi:hypothetical protein
MIALAPIRGWPEEWIAQLPQASGRLALRPSLTALRTVRQNCGSSDPQEPRLFRIAPEIAIVGIEPVPRSLPRHRIWLGSNGGGGSGNHLFHFLSRQSKFPASIVEVAQNAQCTLNKEPALGRNRRGRPTVVAGIATRCFDDIARYRYRRAPWERS